MTSSTLETKFLECLGSFPNHQATTDQLRHHLDKMEIDMNTLAVLINTLLTKNLIDLKKTSQGQLMYTLVKLEEKQKVDDLENEEKLVYSFIKQVGTQGIWVRTLANRTNLHQNVLNKALKKLEQRQLVKTVKSVKLGNKKLYMLYELEPSKEVTGGIWFSEQALDIDFVETIARACLRYIQQHSFPLDPLSVYPPRHHHYPTLSRITHYIHACKISNVELSSADIQMVLDTLLYDGLIEPCSTTSATITTTQLTTTPLSKESNLIHLEDDDVDDFDEIQYKATRNHRKAPSPGLAKLNHVSNLLKFNATTTTTSTTTLSSSFPTKHDSNTSTNPILLKGGVGMEEVNYLLKWADY